MYRKSLADINCEGFIQTFRVGLQTLNNEVAKLETITSDLDKTTSNLPKTYFEEQKLLLEDADSILNEAAKLKENIFTNLNEMKNVESRLLNIRERLLRFEENPKLLSRGYQPFVPKDSPLTSVKAANDSISNTPLIESQFKKLSISTPLSTSNGNDYIDSASHDNSGLEKEQENFNSFDILSTVKKDIEIQKQSSKKKSHKKATKIYDDPIMARAMVICSRWFKDDSADSVSSMTANSCESEDNFDSFNILSTVKKNLNKNNDFKQNGKTHQSDLCKNNFTPKTQNRLFKLNDNKNAITPLISIKNKKNQLFSDEFETVEFTPGMTTKVRKSIK